jgi:hypothetical protein
MKIITAEIVNQARSKKHGRTPSRQGRIDQAIDAFQIAMIELNGTAPTYGQSAKVGRARKEL